jgi:hypothetical protein
VGRSRAPPSRVRHARLRCVTELADTGECREELAATEDLASNSLKRDNLRHLLRSLSDPAEARQSVHGAQVTCQVAASLLSAEDGTAKLDGSPPPTASGRPIAAGSIRLINRIGAEPLSLYHM